MGGYDGDLSWNDVAKVWQGSCYDADACAVNNGGCGPDATCSDLPPPAPNGPDGRICVCNRGFEGDGITCNPNVPPGTVMVTMTLNVPISQSKDNITFITLLQQALANDTGGQPSWFDVVSVKDNGSGQTSVSIILQPPEGTISATDLSSKVTDAAANQNSNLNIYFHVIGVPIIIRPAAPETTTKEEIPLYLIIVLAVLGTLVIVLCIALMLCWAGICKKPEQHHLELAPVSPEGARFEEKNLSAGATPRTSGEALMAAQKQLEGHQGGYGGTDVRSSADVSGELLSSSPAMARIGEPDPDPEPATNEDDVI